MSEQTGNFSEKLASLLSNVNEDNRHGDVWDKVSPEVVKVKRLHPDAVIPTKAHEHDAGFDLVAVEDVTIEPGETALVKTGIAVELPVGYELQIRPRSGITLKTKLRVQFGTVDSNYRGEVGVIIENVAPKILPFNSTRYEHVDGTFTETDTHTYDDKRYGEITEHDKVAYKTYLIRKGDRIAQAIIQRLPSVQFTEVDELGESDRGEGGFGSTGVREGE